MQMKLNRFIGCVSTHSFKRNIMLDISYLLKGIINYILMLNYDDVRITVCF